MRISVGREKEWLLRWYFPNGASILACFGGNSRQSRLLEVCREPNCNSIPFVCSNHQCDYHDRHPDHNVVLFKRLFTTINTRAEPHEESKRACKAMTGVLDKMLANINQLKHEHEMYSGQHFGEFTYNEVRTRLINQDAQYTPLWTIWCTKCPGSSNSWETNNSLTT